MKYLYTEVQKMVGNIKIHYEGETAIDLTDPEDFMMMAILRNTEVTSSPKPITEHSIDD